MSLTAKVKFVTGNTKHLVRGAQIKSPAFVTIVPDGERSFLLLLRFNEAGEELADTWHESITAAKKSSEV